MDTHVELEAADSLGADLGEEEEDAACIRLDQFVELLLGSGERGSACHSQYIRSHSDSQPGPVVCRLIRRIGQATRATHSCRWVLSTPMRASRMTLMSPRRCSVDMLR